MLFGIVENVTDPLKLGRVRVRVYGSHDNRKGDEYNIKEKDLAWSEVMMPGNTPAKSGVGHSVNLLVGSLVCGIFKDLAQQEFMVMGSLPTKTAGIEDNNIRVRAGVDPNAAEPIGEYQPPSTYAPKYPYNNVFETESGHVKEYDDTPGLERITQRHKSGTQYEIDPDGSKNERIVRDNYKLVIGQDTLEVYGNVRIIVSGQADIAVANDVNLAVGGNLAANITGTANITSIDDMTLKANEDGKKIILDGEVSITKNLVVEKLTTTSNSTTPIELDTHKHEYTTPTHAAGTGNTEIPTNP